MLISETAALFRNHLFLIILVAPPGAGKTAILQNLQNGIHSPLINVNLEISRRMLELTERQRVLKLQPFFRQIIRDTGADTVLLDNLELLFDTQLQQDPLILLQQLSRNRTLVAAWNGNVEGKYLTYAEPDHPEYRRYKTGDFLLVSPN